MKKVIKVIILALVAAVASMALSSPMAHAKPDAGDGNDGGGKKSSASTCSTADTADQKYLAMNRWIDGTNDFHSRYDLGVSNINQVAQNAQRSVQGVMFSFGNSLYSVTGSLVGWSNKFCPLTTLGGTVDKAAGTVAKAVLNSGIAVTLVVLLIFSALFSGLSRESGAARGNLRKVISKLIIIGIMAAMMAGASNSTGGGINGSKAPYKPGVLSPGWVALTIDDVITSIAMTPAVALTSTCDDKAKDAGAGGCGIASDPMGGAKLDCGPYRKALNQMYLEDAKKKSISSAKYIPGMVVSNMWQITGYRAWTVAQYGDQNGNGWSRVACHQLDIKAGVPAKGTGDSGSWDLAGTNNKDNDLYYSYAVTAAVLGKVAGMDRKEAVAAVNDRAPAWRAGDNSAELDKALVAWAVCIPPGEGSLADIGATEGWKAPTGNSYLIHDGGEREKAEKGESKKFDKACHAFFNNDGNPDNGMFDWGDGDAKINKDAKDAPASVKAFLIALHGNYVPGASGAVLAHNVAAVCTIIVFGGLALAQIVIKVLMVLMLFFTFIVMMMVLLPNGDTSKLKRYVAQYIGLALFSAFMILILSIVVLFTGVILQLVGTASGGPTTLMSMLAGGVAPVVSVIGIHFVFKKMGLPSPVTMKGGLGWGAALAGGAGFAAMSGGLDAVQNKVRSGVSRAGSALGNKTADGTYRRLLGKGKGETGGGGGDQKGKKGQLGKTEGNQKGSSDSKGLLDKDGKPLNPDAQTDKQKRQEAAAAWSHAVREKAGQRAGRVAGVARGAATGARRAGGLASFALQNPKVAAGAIRRGWQARPSVRDVRDAAAAKIANGARRTGANLRGNLASFAGATTSEKLGMVGRGVVRTGKRAAIMGGAAALGTAAFAAAPVALPGLAVGAGLVAGGGVLAKRVGGESRAARIERIRDERIANYRQHQHQKGEAVLAEQQGYEAEASHRAEDAESAAVHERATVAHEAAQVVSEPEVKVDPEPGVSRSISWGSASVAPVDATGKPSRAKPSGASPFPNHIDNNGSGLDKK